MNNKTHGRKKIEDSTKDSSAKTEIWFPDGSVFEVEFPTSFSIKELLHEVALYFDLDPEQWSLCLGNGKVLSNDEIVQNIISNDKEIRLKRLLIVPEGKLA